MTGRFVTAPRNRVRDSAAPHSTALAAATGDTSSADAAARAAATGTGATADTATAHAATTHGRNRVTTRALTRVVTAITAEAMGVSARHVSVHLADAAGQLQVTVIAPISVPALTAARRTGAAPATAGTAGGSLLARAAIAQAGIRDRVGQLTGSAVGPVTLHLSDAQITGTERVT